MDMDAMVELVFQEIVKKFKQKSKHQSVCFIANERELELEHSLEESYHIDYFSNENDSKDYQMVVIPRLTVTMLANLANGVGSTDEEQFILASILRGKKVIVLKDRVEYYSYKSSAPVLLYKLYEEYERKLKGYSVLFLKIDELLAKKEIAAEMVDEPEVEPVAEPAETEIKNAKSCVPATARSHTLSKKLISESDLQKLYLQNIKEITVGKNCIITPLARDFIRTHNLVIHHERGNTK